MSQALELARSALGGAPVWVVGGAVRDRLLGRQTEDVDLAVEGDPGPVAATLRRAAPHGTAAFQLSDEFGAWRVVSGDHAWHIDVNPLRGDLEADLRARDVTINAMAEPLAGGEVIDPTGGRQDLAAGRLRAASERAFADDPLRTLRLARFACELDLSVEARTAELARASAVELTRVAPERVLAELKRIVASPRSRAGIELAAELGVLEH